jgi:AcrR family transcriptional regulator
MAKRGRKPFRVTKALRSKVELLVCTGMSHEAIAHAIGCTPPTLYKHFGDELAHGRARKRAEIIAMLQRSARAGNVSAQKKLEEMSRLADAQAAFDQPPAAKPEKLGKKEAAAAAARNVGAGGGEWGDDLRVPDRPLN